MNTWKSGTLPSNTVQNPKNDRHYMTITTRGGKQTIDPPMLSKEENVIKDNDKVVLGSGEVEDNTGKDVEVTIKVIHMPRSPPPFPQRLVKKTEDGKYRILYEGPSSGNRCVINEHTRPDSVGGNLKN